jgi:hypothetical protein
MRTILSKKTVTLVVIVIIFSLKGGAQDSSRVFFTTGAGIIKSPGALSKVFHPSIAFNSGIELVGKQNWFLQGTLDFNTLKYNQQLEEDGSPYLFQNTNSSLVMLAVNGGKNFHFGNNKWFASVYTGAGYLNIGEPRLINHAENTIRQEVSRKGHVFGKAGTRIGYKTRIKFLQTIYFDGAYWATPLEVQGSKLSGLSFFLGARMSMK